MKTRIEILAPSLTKSQIEMKGREDKCQCNVGPERIPQDHDMKGVLRHPSLNEMEESMRN